MSVPVLHSPFFGHPLFHSFSLNPILALEWFAGGESLLEGFERIEQITENSTDPDVISSIPVKSTVRYPAFEIDGEWSIRLPGRGLDQHR